MIRDGLLSGMTVQGTLTIEAGRLLESDEDGSLISRDVFRYPEKGISVRNCFGSVDFEESSVTRGRFEILSLDDDAYDPLFSVIQVNVLESEDDGYTLSYELAVRHGQLKLDGKNLRIDGDGYTFCLDLLGSLASRYIVYAMDELREVFGLRLLSESIRGKRVALSVYREETTRGFGNGEIGFLLSERVEYDAVRVSARAFDGEQDEDTRNVVMTLTGYRKKMNAATGEMDYVRSLVMTEELVGSVRVGKSESGMDRIEWLMGDTFVRLEVE